MSYRPLPSFLMLQPSKIEGLGLFTLEELDKNVVLGVTHVADAETTQLFRTPLGGFINHSEKPNCKLYEIGRFKYLRTMQQIPMGAELTLKYTMYDPTES
jgi:SET domain-containing protein